MLTLVISCVVLLGFSGCPTVSPATPPEMRLLPGEDLFTDVAFSADDRLMYVASSNRTVYVYSVPDLKPLNQLVVGQFDTYLRCR